MMVPNQHPGCLGLILHISKSNQYAMMVNESFKTWSFNPTYSEVYLPNSLELLKQNVVEHSRVLLIAKINLINFRVTL